MARLVPVLPIIAGCIAVDQLTKALARKYLAPDGFFSFAADTLRLQYAENTGAFLGLGAALPDPWRHVIFTVSVGLFLGALLVYLLFSRTDSRFSLACLALVCGGGLSNLIDRIVYDASARYGPASSTSPTWRSQALRFFWWLRASYGPRQQTYLRSRPT
jgi:signal peptidase II